jgi:hypothetical protein
MSKKKTVMNFFGMSPDQFVHIAFRYYLGRMTISANCFARDLARAWPELEHGTRDMIARELELEFDRDDAARARGESGMYLPLGADCDRAAWEEVRELYRSTT